MNTFQIFSLLNKSNCKKCGYSTCLAFAGNVYLGKKKLSDCPFVSEQTLELQNDSSSQENDQTVENRETLCLELKEKVKHIDLKKRATDLGGIYKNHQLTIHILGKQFSIADTGEITTDLHVIPWLLIPVYEYLLRHGKAPLTDKWVTMRELVGGKDQEPLFIQRCEKPLRKIGDEAVDLFEDLIRLFNAKEVNEHFDADISVVLHPLPKLPVMICYWIADGEFASDLRLFFDQSASDYLDVRSIHSLCCGIAAMLEKLIHQHGSQKTIV